ncbi:wax ester synthase/diacylglycerol acyltransferase 11-like isoform X1 [Lycium barbarum]|uniref:wax ester synthase/diacylglycerol acyltransferase 11-like isoform X1 n=1 Tax=Lycium barbarum TaxID=112863 RepID=UPI00293EC5AE|nr:wax ester synthase/diacylglycerol acyltransferase 11-like isoform X1 [Lycium barbarum]
MALEPSNQQYSPSSWVNQISSLLNIGSSLDMERGRKKMILKPILISKNLNKNGEEEAVLLSPTSQMFHEPDYNVYVLAIMGWKVPIEVDAMKAEIQRTMLKHPRFSSLQVMDEINGSGKMRWVPTTVNMDDHIIVPQIAHDNMDTDKLVEEDISSLSTTNVDMSKPQWEFHVLNMKTSHAEATSIFRIHHSIGDGTSLMSLLLSCFRTTSDPTSLPTLPVSSSKDKSSLSLSNNKKTIWSLMWQYLIKFWLLIKFWFNTVVDVFLFIATALFLKDSQSPFTATRGYKWSTRQKYTYRTISLDDIKFIKNVTDCSVNDVVLGITQAAMSRYIHRRYEVEGKRKFLPEGMRCRANVIVNLRPALGVQTLAETIEKNVKVIQGNCIGFVIFPLTIAQFSNPLDYVRKSKTSMDRKKHSLGSLCTFYVSKLFLKFFGFKGAAKLAKRVPFQTTLAMSNVIGQLEEISCAGHPLVFVAPTCSGYPTGIMVHVCSYAKKLTFAIAADEGIIPDLNQLGDDFVDSFMLIKEAALSKLRTKAD